MELRQGCILREVEKSVPFPDFVQMDQYFSFKDKN